MTAVIAPESEKAMFRNTTRQIVPELPLDKPRNWTLARLLTPEERLQLFDDDAVQNSLFRLAGNIFEGTVQHAEALKAGVQPTQVIVGSATL